MVTLTRGVRWFAIACIVGCVGLSAGLDARFTSNSAEAAQKKKGKDDKKKDEKKPPDRLALLSEIRKEMPALQVAAKTEVSFTGADLDQLLKWNVKRPEEDLAPLCSDEVFIRRATLDVTGRVPSVKEMESFLSDRASDKREKLIERLLASKEFGQNWAKYWREVVMFTTPVKNKKISPDVFEDWLADQFNKNVGWDRIVAEMVAAKGSNQEKGPDNYIIAQEDKPERLAAETARIFMGINVQCAECHDHPFDQWKRTQFHELAAFFSKGTYYMPDLYKPGEKTEMKAKFLLGEVPPPKLDGDERRVALAAYLVYNQSNYWFSRAYVNRVWTELYGYGFYAVDSLGPDGECQQKNVINRLAALFRYREFRPKWLMSTIMNSRWYQRDIRDMQSDTDLFTAPSASRLRADQVVRATEQVLGDGKYARSLQRVFLYDPAMPQNDVDGSIQQALMMMNNPALNDRIEKSALTKDLLKLTDNTELVKKAFLGILSRQPTQAESTRFAAHLKSASTRDEAVHDLVWVLVNSAEFISKR